MTDMKKLVRKMAQSPIHPGKNYTDANQQDVDGTIDGHQPVRADIVHDR